MKSILLITLFICISIVVSGTLTERKNFLESVETEDIEALMSLVDIDEDDCNDLGFIEGIRKAAKKGSLESLKILSKHKCLGSLNVGIHDQLVKLALNHGHKKVFRWLYNNIKIFNHHSVFDQMQKAIAEKDYETFRFLFSHPITSTDMVLEVLAKAKDNDIIQWIETYGWALQNVKYGRACVVQPSLFDDGLVDFVLSPLCAEYSQDTIEDLVRVLLNRYLGALGRKSSFFLGLR